MFYVYILKTHDGSFYTGHTDNIHTCITQYQQQLAANGVKLDKLPITLAYQAVFPSKEKAIQIEQQVKCWSYQQKQALIRDDWLEISRLSKISAN